MIRRTMLVEPQGLERKVSTAADGAWSGCPGAQRPRYASKRLPALFAIFFLLLGGCSSKLTQNSDSTLTMTADPPKADERVVVLPKTGDDEQVGMDCVRMAVAHRSSIPDGEFRRALYPWFEPGSLPESEAELVGLLNHASVGEKIAAIGVRYLVVVSGETRTTGGSLGSASVALMIFTVSKSSSISIRVWDLIRVKTLGSAYATATGDTGGGEVLLVPIVITASTEKATCEEITRRLGAIFEPSH